MKEEFDLKEVIILLERTPEVLGVLLKDLSNDLIQGNLGEHTWSPYDIVGHLIHGEETDWMPRCKIILSSSKEKRFVEFDRFAQFETSIGKSIETLLSEFQVLRKNNIKELKSLSISEDDLQLEGIHPEFGRVSLRELFSTWLVHDLGHIAQLTRVMANQYRKKVGPWKAYLGVLNN